jgi:hypothetical protein
VAYSVERTEHSPIVVLNVSAEITQREIQAAEIKFVCGKNIKNLK